MGGERLGQLYGGLRPVYPRHMAQLPLRPPCQARSLPGDARETGTF